MSRNQKKNRGIYELAVVSCKHTVEQVHAKNVYVSPAGGHYSLDGIRFLAIYAGKKIEGIARIKALVCYEPADDRFYDHAIYEPHLTVELLEEAARDTLKGWDAEKGKDYTDRPSSIVLLDKIIEVRLLNDKMPRYRIPRMSIDVTHLPAVSAEAIKVWFDSCVWDDLTARNPTTLEKRLRNIGTDKNQYS